MTDSINTLREHASSSVAVERNPLLARGRTRQACSADGEMNIVRNSGGSIFCPGTCGGDVAFCFAASLCDYAAPVRVHS